jgi:hypothetical protein
MGKNVYEQLADRLSMMGLGMPYHIEMIDILKETFQEHEAEIALLLPTTNTPLKPVTIDTLAKTTDMNREYLESTLVELAEKRLIYSGKTKNNVIG